MAAGAWTFTNGGRTRLLNGTFDIDTDSYKMALFLSTSDIGAASTTFAGVTNEHAAANGYTAGGIAVALTLVDGLRRLDHGPLRGHLRGGRGCAVLLLAR